MKIQNKLSIGFYIEVFLRYFLLFSFVSCPLLADESVNDRDIKAISQNADQLGDTYFIRDLRNWNTQECESIDDIYLRAVCLRKQRYRPHMNIFVTTNKALPEQIESLDNEQCSIFSDKYIQLYCLYTTAAFYAKKKPEKAYNLCRGLQQENLIGECNFYIAVSMVMNLGENADERVSRLMNFCGQIQNSNWRSECYFLLADELAFLGSAEKYLENISAACEHSEKARDFGCFSHVTMILAKDKRKKFCDIIRMVKKPGCYWGMGAAFLIESDDINRSIGQCSLIGKKAFRSFCLGGLSHYAGIGFLHIKDKTMASRLVERCISLPLADYDKKQCILGLGSRWGFNRAPAEGVKNCLSVDIAYRKKCFQGLSQGWLYSGSGFEAFLDQCSIFPQDYQDTCFQHAAKAISLFNLKKNESTCGLFPVRFRKRCYENIENF